MHSTGPIQNPDMPGQGAHCETATRISKEMAGGPSAEPAPGTRRTPGSNIDDTSNSNSTNTNSNNNHEYHCYYSISSGNTSYSNIHINNNNNNNDNNNNNINSSDNAWAPHLFA